MATASTNRKRFADKPTLYQEITDKIIAELEAGCVPWVQPWGSSCINATLGLPKNAATGRKYSGINILILWSAVAERGFTGQRWLTFRQALALGGNVRKGEKGARLCGNGAEMGVLTDSGIGAVALESGSLKLWGAWRCTGSSLAKIGCNGRCCRTAWRIMSMRRTLFG
jgi:hypothetical protein